LTKQTVLSLHKNVCWHALKRARYVELFCRMCVLNRTSVYLHLFVYIIDQLHTAFFILARVCINRSRIPAVYFAWYLFCFKCCSYDTYLCDRVNCIFRC